jgi:hypothetical protein
MSTDNSDLLKHLAAKYIWWKSPEEALQIPDRIISQVMDIGDYDDAQSLASHFGEDRLRRVLTQAEAGLFSPKSWAYWHYRLGVSKAGEVPNLPQRRVA